MVAVEEKARRVAYGVAPWPFLDGGATAVRVATIFDGATVEEELLWRSAGARTQARLADGDVVVRLGACGFEVSLTRACDGDVDVGGRTVELRELSLCGVRVLPVGPRTCVTVRAGLTTYVVSGTTPPRKLPLAPVGSWRRRAGIAVAALAGATFVVAVQATAPKRPSWAVGETVRVKVSLLMPSLSGGRESSADQPRTAHAVARTTKSARAESKPRTPNEMPNLAQAQAHEQAQQPSPPALAETVLNQDQAKDKERDRAEEDASAATAAAAPAPPKATMDDARKAAAVQARAAGIVGALEQSRVAFLGDVHVVAADVTDRGSVAIGAGDASSAAGSANGASAGTANGASSGGSEFGTLSGGEIGEAYGEGGLGLSGTGEGGSGTGFGTIGLGTIGTIGHGYGTGTGYGYGSSCGGLGGRRASVPVCTIGLAEVRGSCDKDLIRRVVRAHVNELRFCYERELQSHPALAGRVDSTFVIGFDGHVTSSSATGLPRVDDCVAAAVERWQFVPRCVGEVHYPFTFEPVPDASRSAL